MAKNRSVRKTQTCVNCVYAVRLIASRRQLLICANSAASPGMLTLTRKSSSCRNFRPQRPFPRPVLRQPLNSQIRFIPLTRGKVAILDAPDYDRFSAFRWYASKKQNAFYACRHDKHRCIYMHRLLLDPPKGFVVDHIDGNSLNNRKTNLRLCTHANNVRNRRPVRASSKYKGVCWNKRKRRWAARITCSAKRYHLGYFRDELEAATAYDKKAAELFRQFARLNFPACPRMP